MLPVHDECGAAAIASGTMLTWGALAWRSDKAWLKAGCLGIQGVALARVHHIHRFQVVGHVACS